MQALQVSVENVQGLERRLKVSVPVETVDAVVEELFQKAGKSIKLSGFRPGKVPRRILEERYGESIRQHEAAPKLIEKTLWEAFKKAEIEPIGRPTVEGEIVLKPGKAFDYAVLFEGLPVFDVNDLAGVEIEKIVSDISDADLDKAIEQLRQEHSVMEEITLPAQNNDTVTLSYTVEINGEPVDLEKTNHATVVLGKIDPASTTIIPALAEQLLGLSAGDKKIIEAVFPDDYAALSVAGKTAKFSVNIHHVKRQSIPELTDEFVKQFDDAASVAEFKKNIHSNMAFYLKSSLADLNKLNVFDALAKANPIDLPKAMVEAQIENMTRSFVQSMMKKKVQDNELKQYLPLFSRYYKKSAQHRVRLSLLLEEYLKKNPMTITDDMVDAMVKERSALYQDPEAWIKEYMAAPANKEHLHQILLELAVAEKLRATAKSKEVKLDYFTVLEREKASQQPDFSDVDEVPHVHDEHCHHDHAHEHEVAHTHD